MWKQLYKFIWNFIQKDVSVKRDFPAARFSEAVPKPDLQINPYSIVVKVLASWSVLRLIVLLFHYRNFIFKKR